MLQPSFPARAITDTAARLSSVTARTAGVIGVIGLALTIASFRIDTVALAFAAATAGLSMLLLAVGARCASRLAQWFTNRDCGHLAQIFGDSADACLMTAGATGDILWCNATARARLSSKIGQTIETVLSDLHGEPETFARRLHYFARRDGQAEHALDLAGHGRQYRVSQLSQEHQLWQISFPDPTDRRDSLTFEMLQFHADGTLSYASPGLRDTLAGKSPRLKQLFEADMPPVGQRTALPAEYFGPHCSGLWLPGAPEDAEITVIVSKSPPEATDAQDPSPPPLESLQDLPIGLAHIDADGTLRGYNAEARRLLQLRGVGGHAQLSDLVEGLGRPIIEWINDIGSGRVPRATEVLRLTRAPVETYLKMTLCRTSPGDVGRLVAVISDVTEFKSLEAKFTQSQKMQAIGQLAGGVAHDFNNLLTAIAGHCDLLLLRHDRHDPDYPDLMQIQQNTNRAAALVRQLLALSRKQSLQLVTLELQETMTDVIHLLNRLVGEKITLTLRQGEAVAPIRSDKRQFEQVLMNLVVNARDALPMGGEIRIETQSCTLPHGLTRDQVTLPPGAYTVITVSDDGIGIPQSVLGKVFDPFFTTKRQGEGTGLGLSTVYGIVKQSGGYIFVDSEEGVGTTFSLYFSAQKDEKPKPATRPNPATSANTFTHPRALVLLVEDEAPVRSFAARALELQGHRVITADSGEAALEILADRQIRPDCFVSDVIMPGLDGPGWIMQVRDQFPDTPVLFISGYAEDNRLAAQARISNAAFLGKPFSLAEFTAAVDTQLRRTSAAA